MRVLFLFLDGIGLGPEDAVTNPFAVARMPTLEGILGGRKLLAGSAPADTDQASLLALDAGLGVPGLPQSATGQAALLTGKNVPALIGEHYGPKPNEAVAEIVRRGTLFSRLAQAGRAVALLNAYPPRYFDAVNSGRRLYSAIPLAVSAAGLRLFDHKDFFSKRALSADFSGEAWVTMLGYPDAPVLTPEASGSLMSALAANYEFCLFEYWSTDYAGHKQDMPWAVTQLEALDAVLRGLLDTLSADQLILLTSDHGNMEDLSTRRHTNAAVPALIIGSRTARHRFTADLRDLTGVAPAIERLVASTDSGPGARRP